MNLCLFVSLDGDVKKQVVFGCKVRDQVGHMKRWIRNHIHPNRIKWLDKPRAVDKKIGNTILGEWKGGKITARYIEDTEAAKTAKETKQNE